MLFNDEKLEDARIFADLAIGILTVHPNGKVLDANEAARGCFHPVDPIGHAVPALMALAGMVDIGHMAWGPETRKAQRTVRAPDGRAFDCCSTRIRNGYEIVTVHDVTAHLPVSRKPVPYVIDYTTIGACLNECMTTAERGGHQVALIIAGLDQRFNDVKETLGHRATELLLTKVAERLRLAAGQTNIVARLNETEFAIVQSDAPQPSAATAVMERIIDMVERAYASSGEIIHIGVRMGAAVSTPGGDDPDVLLRHARLALSRANLDGAKKYRFFDAELNTAVQERRHLEAELRAALTLKQFELAYQPQYRLGTSEPIGFEALLRWTGSSRGPVAPSTFIPVAEEIGLIIPIGEWVLRTACREAAAWPDRISVAVNVSPIQFRDGTLVSKVFTALRLAGLDPSRLELEVTESLLLEDGSEILGQLHTLRARGIRIAMDDFGTGYSSLNYLCKLPFDKIKIDKSFVQDGKPVRGHEAIIRAVVGLGASLGMTTIAEGVETPEQCAWIAGLGCDGIQGFLTGRPVAAAHVPQTINSPLSVTHRNLSGE